MAAGGHRLAQLQLGGAVAASYLALRTADLMRSLSGWWSILTTLYWMVGLMFMPFVWGFNLLRLLFTVWIPTILIEWRGTIWWFDLACSLFLIFVWCSAVLTQFTTAWRSSAHWRRGEAPGLRRRLWRFITHDDYHGGPIQRHLAGALIFPLVLKLFWLSPSAADGTGGVVSPAAVDVATSLKLIARFVAGGMFGGATSTTVLHFLRWHDHRAPFHEALNQAKPYFLFFAFWHFTCSALFRYLDPADPDNWCLRNMPPSFCRTPGDDAMLGTSDVITYLGLMATAVGGLWVRSRG